MQSDLREVKRAAARLLLAVTTAASCSAAAAAELGVFRGNAPDGPPAIDAYNLWLGKSVQVGSAFEAQVTWTNIAGESWNLKPWSDWVRAQPGRNIALAVPMLPASGASLASCAAGQYDTYWARLANNLAYYGLHWAYLRLGWEMDGTWFAWNAAQGSGKEASFAGCFRRVVQVMRQTQPANQWKFVLNPSNGFSSKSYLDAVWPGDAYVDVVALDYYDQSWAPNTYPYPSTCDASCRATRQENAWNSYSWRLYAVRDFAIAHGKQVAFPEWGTGTRPDGHGGGDNPGFIRKMYNFIQDPANKVAFQLYWDYPAQDFNCRLSGATSFPQAAATYKQLFGATSSSTNTAPTVSITSPSAGQTVAGSGTSARAPYGGAPVALPGTFAAVNFDKGGEGIGYHDLSSGNLGGQYRTSESVDIYRSSDSASGPYEIENFQNGEWLSYTVNVPANGNYDLGIRASNNYGTGAFHIEVDGQNVTGTLSMPKTGSWTTYQWFGRQNVPLAAGTHVLKLVVEAQWFNVSALRVLASAGTTTGGTPGSSGYAGTPYSGTPIALPVAFPAANFDKGGEGIAYHDLSSGNLGGLYRLAEGVDIYASADAAGGSYQIANFQTGEWMNYSVNVPANGNYDLSIRASNNLTPGAFHIEVDGVNVTGSIPVPVTGSWNTYQWFGKKGVALTAGKHVVKLVAEQQWFNVSALSVFASADTMGGGTSGSTGYAGTPYGGTPIALPVAFPAVNFDRGGDGVAYRDLSSGNLGGQYRPSESVDIYASADTVSGPYQVQNFQNGEWLSYTVNVPANGSYEVAIRTSNNFGAGAFHVEVDGVNVTGTMAVPKTGSWNTYQWVGKQGVPLTAGKHVLKLVAETQWFNVSSIRVQ